MMELVDPWFIAWGFDLDVMHWLMVFGAMTGMDFAYAEWTKLIVSRRALAAGVAGSCIMAFNTYMTISYVAEPWLITAVIVGAFLGTWASVKRG